MVYESKKEVLEYVKNNNVLILVFVEDGL